MLFNIKSIAIQQHFGVSPFIGAASFFYSDDRQGPGLTVQPVLPDTKVVLPVFRRPATIELIIPAGVLAQ
jgi:hypothetical protein